MLRIASVSDDLEVGTVTSTEKRDSKIRPFHQNWWPVTTSYSLDPTRPNSVELLNQKLVLFHDGQEWKCLDDRCSHRFAPLSEGRVKQGCLQCAYHGWEFNGQGSCLKVPQTESGTGGRPVNSYPVRIEAGMVFVWADPDSYQEIGTKVSIPIFRDLERLAEAEGEGACYMRDLPYGYELLGENLLDLSHLPFSHHGVGNLNREIGGPLPFKMLSQEQKSDDNPLFEAFLEDAACHDPFFQGPYPVPSNATTKLGFYESCHVRYTRKTFPGSGSYIALYCCPTSSTKSRVFLFNVFPSFLPNDEPAQRKTVRQRVKEWTSPKGLQKKLQTKIVKRLFTPLRNHQMSHQIFDGDGIFLHKQGDRMQRGKLTYKDYHTPAAADVTVNAFRRYATAAARATREVGNDSAADAILPSTGYLDNLPRSEMLDRYESHTKNCKICSNALEKAKTKKKRLETIQSGLTGAVGASAATLAGIAFLTTSSELAVPAAVTRIAIGSLATMLGASVGASKWKNAMERNIQQFLFEDYIHSERD